MMSELSMKKCETPLGPIRLVATETALVGLYQETQTPTLPEGIRTPTVHACLDQAAAELRSYFDGKTQCFTVPIEMSGTRFQQEVWNALLAIPYGETRSYSDIAHAIGRPKAVRAVGAANGMNRLGLVVPCHRVIGAKGRLTGYAGGLANKEWLLLHESSAVLRIEP